MAKPLIALAAGGTGGHIFPALAIAETLRDNGFDTLMLTDRRGARLIPDARRMVLPAESPFQRNVLRCLRAIAALGAATLATLVLIARRRPCVMIGFGGYPAFGPLLAARLTATPALLHEQNAVLGRTNRMLARSTGYLAISWADTSNVPDGVITRRLGMPVRTAFLDIPPATAPKDDSIALSVVGGSLGAMVFADLVPDAISHLDVALRRRLTITQQCRTDQQAALAARYDAMGVRADIRPFFDDMPRILADSKLVISRAGASSVAELAAAGRPALLVPFGGALDDHQTRNAQQLEAIGGGLCLAESCLTAPALATHLTTLLGDPARLCAMGKAARSLAATDAATAIANWALEIGQVTDKKRNAA